MLVFNDSNIELIDAVLHNADFHISDLPDEASTGTLIINIRRPDWHKQERTRRFFIKLTLVKEVFSQMTFENISKVEYLWKNDLYRKRSDHHSILVLHIDKDERSLTFETESLLATFVFNPAFKVQISDSIEIYAKEDFLKIVGWHKSNFENWEREYKEKSKTVP